MRLRAMVLGTAFGAAACSAACAQQAQPPQIEPSRQYHFGASLSTTYDTNVARGSRTLAAMRGIVREEFIVRPQADAAIVQPFGRQALFLTGAAGYDLRSRNKNLNRQRADVTGGYTAQLGYCRPTLYGAYQAQQSDLATLDDTLVKNLVQAKSISASAQCARGVGPGAQVTVSRTDTKNSAVDQKLSDSTIESLSLAVLYQNPNIGTLGVTYAYSNNEFPNRILTGRPVGDGFWTSSYGVSVERELGSRMTLSAFLARTHVKREFAPAGSPLTFNSTTYGGDLSYRFGTRVTVDASASRLVRPSTRPGKVYDLNTEGTVAVRYELGSRFNVAVGHSIQDVKSNRDTAPLPVTGRPTLTSSRTNSTFGSLQYRQSDNISVTMDLRYEDRNTDVPDLDYKSTRIGLTTKLSY